MKTMVLAYSGGLDTSVCILPLKERYDYGRAITVVADVGKHASKYVKEGDRKQHKDLPMGLAKDMCDKSSSDDLQIIGGEDDRRENFGSEKDCVWGGFGYTTFTKPVTRIFEGYV